MKGPRQFYFKLKEKKEDMLTLTETILSALKVEGVRTGRGFKKSRESKGVGCQKGGCHKEAGCQKA